MTTEASDSEAEIAEGKQTNAVSPKGERSESIHGIHGTEPSEADVRRRAMGQGGARRQPGGGFEGLRRG